jgi:DnaJ-class molecular chaperone
LETPAPGSDEPEVSEASDDLSIPSNYTQALHVLGASADASTDAIKKIVDGLRRSWHPDHARSESDRVYREKRARQINVAWDIVSQRRAVA